MRLLLLIACLVGCVASRSAPSPDATPIADSPDARTTPDAAPDAEAPDAEPAPTCTEGGVIPCACDGAVCVTPSAADACRIDHVPC
jgi:hypothetical protein